MKKPMHHNLKNEAHLTGNMIIMTKDVVFSVDGQTYNHHVAIRYI